MNFVDLFCGIGGASYGAIGAGLSPLLLVDNDPFLSGLLSKELKDVFYQSDLSKWDESLLPIIQSGDVLLCSPPCQSYSRMKTRNATPRANTHDLRFAQTIARILLNTAFKLVVIENVPSFLTSEAGLLIMDALRSCNFHVQSGVFNAVDFRVPQRRNRSLIIGSCYPKIISASEKKRTVRQAFDGLPELNALDRLHQSRRKHSALVMKRIESIPQDGGSRSSLPEELVLNCHKKTNGYRDTYGRMSWDSEAPTITSGCTNPSKGRFLHPVENRAITLREAARLQTLPDSMMLSAANSSSQMAQLIGNAFPSDFVTELLTQLTTP